MSKVFRKDITGLRAIAVIAVTLYHLTHVQFPDISYFKGGFIGVDIFFVISGFLMTKIIMTGLEQGNFSLYLFYKKRAKRICPALLIVSVVFIGLALSFFYPKELITTCRDGLRALLFISNMWFARQTGYFDTDASSRIFLHTWSLSVEWQFYLIYPLLLMVGCKFCSRRNVALLLLFLTVASMIFGCIFSFYEPNKSYFYLPSRAYELLIGGLAYFYPLSFWIKRFNVGSKTLSEKQYDSLAVYAEYLGLGMIALALIVIDSNSAWPNPWSLLPLLGTYLCIAANNEKTVLSNVVIQNIGIWSYAIYLVHWPVIVLCKQLLLEDYFWYLIPVILGLGCLLHYAVERRRNFGFVFLAVYVLLTASTEWIIKNKDEIRTIPDLAFLQDGGFKHFCQELHLGDTSRPVDFIFTGDSLAFQYLDFVGNDVHAVAIVGSACYSSPNFVTIKSYWNQDEQRKCRNRFSELLRVANKYPDAPVIWTQNWSGIGRSLKSNDGCWVNNVEMVLSQDIPWFADQIASSGRKLFIVGVPQRSSSVIHENQGKQCFIFHAVPNIINQFMWNAFDCKPLVKLEENPTSIFVQHIIDNLPQNQGKTSDKKSVVYINLDPVFCDGSLCRIMFEDTLEPVFYDGLHLHKRIVGDVLDYILKFVGIERTAQVTNNFSNHDNY